MNDLYSKLMVDGKFAIRSLGSVNVLKAVLDFEAAMRKIERYEMEKWPICTECKREVWRTIDGKCEECLGIVSPMFAPVEESPGPAEAITAFMGWLTSRDEVAGPFSARHEAGQAVQLVKKFCEAQGWDIDDAQWEKQIHVLKQKYPKE